MTRALTRLQVYPDAKYTNYDVEARDADAADLQRFLVISAELAGFSVAELQATGNVRHLFEELGTIVGVAVRREFVRAPLDPAVRLSDPFHGPLARNVIRMWYLGQWQRLPDEWTSALAATFKPFDEFGRNFNRVISARAYREGLAWPAIGANPPAAKQPGFASWTEPPE
jgi:hypothetical protein